MGCNIALSLLELYVDETFKEKYIRGLIALGPAWAGSAKTPESWISGPIYQFVPIQLSNMLLPSSSTWPSMLGLFPFEFEFDDDGKKTSIWRNETIVETKRRKYTATELYDLIQDTSELAPLGPSLLNGVLKWRAKGKHPGVHLSSIYITDVKTPLSVKFPGDEIIGFGTPTVTKYSEGDGTVNRDAMEVPLVRWQKSQQQKYTVAMYPLQLGGHVNHVGMVSDLTVVRHVLNILTG